MHNDSEKISANEINRYVYCNYQWYYNRLYGSKHLNSLKKDLNKSLGVKSDPKNHAFIRGNKYHKKYDRKYKIKGLIITTFMIILAIVLIYIMKDTIIEVGVFL